MRADQLYRYIINARTFPDIQAAIDYAAPIDLYANPQLVRAQLEQLVIGSEDTGGLLTQTEFGLASFCTEEKLKKRAPDHRIRMIKRRAFIIENLHADYIREIEKMITDSSASKVSEFDFMEQN